MKKDFRFAVLLAAIPLAIGCEKTTLFPPLIRPVEVAKFQRVNPQAQWVDVRTTEEYAQERIAGAKLIPVQELEKHAAELDPDRPILLYCRSGKRSQKAAELLGGLGFKQVYQLEGGIEAWRSAGLPVESSSPAAQK